MLRFLSVIVMFTALPFAGIAKPSIPVGDLFNAERIEIRGLTSFSSDMVKEALMRDLDVLVTSVPSAPRGRYIQTVDARIKDGLFHAGYVQSVVSTKTASRADRLIIEIVEGAQHTAKSIQFEGLSPEIIARLKTTQAYIRFTTENWVTDAPARYAQPVPDGYQKTVQTMFAQVGFFFAKFSISMPIDPKTHTVGFTISVTDLGAPGRLRNIDIQGVSKADQVHIREMVSLQIGAGVDAQILDRMKTQLAKTGRFHRVDYQVTPHVESQRIDVAIKVTGHALLPSLRETLSPAQNAMLAFAHWTQQLSTSRQHLYFRRTVPMDDWHLNEIELALSTDEGLIIKPTFAFGGGTIILKPGHVGVYVPDSPHYCSGPGLMGAMNVSLNVDLDIESPPLAADGSQGEAPMSFNATMGFQSEGPNHLNIDLGWSSAGAVVHGRHLAVLDDASTDSISLGTKPEHAIEGVQKWVLHPQTGQLKQMTFYKNGQEQFRFWSTDRAIEKPENRAALPESKNVYDVRAPVWSCLSFAAQHVLPIESLVDSPERVRDIRSALPILASLSGEVMNALPIPGDVTDPPGNPFQIPPSKLRPKDSITGLMMGIVRHVQALFSTTSWPSLWCRHALMILTGQTEAIGPELHRLSNSHSLGPLGYLTYAQSLHILGHPASTYFAKKGLLSLSDTDFTREFTSILKDQGTAGTTLQTLLRVVLEASAADLKTLMRVLPKAHRSDILSTVYTLRNPQSSTQDYGLSRIVPVILDAGLRDWTTRQLTRIAQ